MPSFRDSVVCRSASIVSVAIALVAAFGCGGPERNAVHPGAKLEFEAGERTIVVEVVYEAASRQLGLMFREPENLPEDAGMLFVYPTPEYLGFWMRNTIVPLSIAYISDDGEILQVSDMKPKDERTVPSNHRVRFALEMNQGWFARANFGVGSKLPDFRENLEPFAARAEPSPSDVRR